MRILFDQGTPAPLRRHLGGHAVDTAYERGWSTIENGLLIEEAESVGYQLLVTTDQHIRYQVDLSASQLAVIVLTSTSWPRIQLKVREIRDAIDAAKPGSYREISI